MPIKIYWHLKPKQWVISDLFSNEGNLLRALEFYLEALNIDEKLQNNSGIARHVGNIGIVYYELKIR